MKNNPHVFDTYPVMMCHVHRFTEVINNIGAGNGYTANISIGTPPQPLTLGIDTGSTDTWVLSNTANICLNKTLIAEGVTCAHGTFNSNKSSTIATAVAGGFSATYLDKTGSTGDYITDVLMIAGNTLKGMQMGLAFNSTDSQGTLGLGYDTLEGATTKYASFIDQLVLQGIINTKAFSLYLNDLSSSTGNLLFGGIDTEKFTGTLQTLPLIPSTPNGTIVYYGVALTAVSVVSSDTTQTYNLTSNASDGSTVPEIGVVMDSGSVFTYLPTATVQSMYNLLGAVQSPLASYYVFVDCSLLTPATGPVTTIDFQFTGPTGPIISVPLNEMVFPLSDYAEIADHISALGTLPFEDTCMFGLLGADEAGGASVLGDTFLRSAYLVYDLDSNSIGIAQTVFNSTSSNVVEFAAGQSGFPVVSGVSSSHTSSATGLSTGSEGTTSKPTGTGSGAANSSTSKAAAGSSRPPPFDGRGLVVLSVVGLCSLVGVGWFLG
ncbi:acid protease [Hyaloscypha hepaticicola]|uniref:Acid protease n=1 Tax=Hyaloscypha hepaticicola TaxID=2082293 RepID=A0A2J6Q993_9HELO|nr:acid protease [Hyaloscypha hepaticicola]